MFLNYYIKTSSYKNKVLTKFNRNAICETVVPTHRAKYQPHLTHIGIINYYKNSGTVE